MNMELIRSRAFVALWAVLISATALAGSASAQIGGVGVTVFTGPNFRGQSASFRSDVSNLVPYNLNDKIRSIQIPAGESWEVCQDVDFGNQCQVLTSSVSDLRSIGWDDRISSLRRVAGGGYRNRQGSVYNDGNIYNNGGYPVGTGGYATSVITVYTNPNFRGQSATFQQDTPNLVPYGLNDKISSIQIPDGESWEVCQDVDYGNQCQVLTGSVSDLRSMGWNDRISSLRRVGGNGYRSRRSGGVYPPNDQQQGLVFYDRPGFRGSSRVVNGASSNVGINARSVQLRSGGAWQICDDSGRCANVNGDVADISQLGLNGRITSVRPAGGIGRFFRR